MGDRSVGQVRGYENTIEGDLGNFGIVSYLVYFVYWFLTIFTMHTLM
jgi:hypothetical protein